LRWRIWRRDSALMEMIARDALVRSGVCDESDSLVRCAWDYDTGQLIVMVYLAHFDHAAWTMSRHIEFYLMRQFKGLYGISVHSVHLDVIRARAFKDTPMLKSATALRAVLRERRKAGVKPTGVTGRKIGKALTPWESANAFAATAQAGLDDGIGAGKTRRAPGKSASRESGKQPRRDPIQDALHNEDYLSVPGYEVSEVEFDEFLNSLPADSRPASSQPAPGTTDGLQALGRVIPQVPSDMPAAFLAETDLIKRDRAPSSGPQRA
jgi:hypothetical protein